MTNSVHSKKEMRVLLKQQRHNNASFNLQNTPSLIDNILHFVRDRCPKGQVIAGFWPLEDEPDLRPLLYQLHEEGYQVALPETPPKGSPLCFRIWTPDITMVEGRYKTLHPDGDMIIPELVLVPLLAFDRLGNRLGYGGGYYDRTLRALPNAKSAGVVFSYQEIDQVPVEEFDHLLPVVVTEAEIIFRKQE